MRLVAAKYAAPWLPAIKRTAILRRLYTRPIFLTAEAIDLCIEHKLHVNCGSHDMIEQLGRRAPGSEITLRINPGFGHGHSRKTNTGGDQSKHGIWHEQLGDCRAIAERLGVIIRGVHMHIGSGTDLEHLSARMCGHGKGRSDDRADRDLDQRRRRIANHVQGNR